jgi:hypothetical protein
MALVSRSEFAIFGLWEGCHVNYVDLLLKAVAREISYGLNHVAGSRNQDSIQSVGQFAAIVRFFAGNRRSAPLQCGLAGRPSSLSMASGVERAALRAL